MKFDVPKITKRLELQRYAEEFGDAALVVWVNPPMRMLNELVEAEAEVVFTILAELWSQGGDENTHWTSEEVKDLALKTYETDPGLFRWLRDETFLLIGEHRKAQKKA
jgi:hypothetical protein